MLSSQILRLQLRHLKSAALFSIGLTLSLAIDGVIGLVPSLQPAEAQSPASRALTLRSDVQEANAQTGVVTARGNVQINYPARQIQATAAQAQYFSRERRIVLSGNVYVLQQGNSLRGETITYLIDEGRFVALPRAPRQVESIYLVPENSAPAIAPAPAPTPFDPEAEFDTPGTPLPPSSQP